MSLTLHFAEYMRKLKPNFNTKIFLSFDIISLFINVPLDETIEICVNFLYRSHLTSPSFPGSVFVKLSPSAFALFSADKWSSNG